MATRFLSDHFFDTVTIKTNEKTHSIYDAALKENINLRKADEEHLSVAFDEAKKLDDVNLLLNYLEFLKQLSKM